MNFRLAQPAHIIDINFINGMDYTRRDKGVLRIGCLSARQSHLLDSPIVREHCPLLAEALTLLVMSRYAIAARCAVAWPTPIQRRSCPPCSSPWMALSQLET